MAGSTRASDPHKKPQRIRGDNSPARECSLHVATGASCETAVMGPMAALAGREACPRGLHRLPAIAASGGGHAGPASTCIRAVNSLATGWRGLEALDAPAEGPVKTLLPPTEGPPNPLTGTSHSLCESASLRVCSGDRRSLCPVELRSAVEATFHSRACHAMSEEGGELIIT
jgi:hypothetical protein